MRSQLHKVYVCVREREREERSPATEGGKKSSPIYLEYEQKSLDGWKHRFLLLDALLLYSSKKKLKHHRFINLFEKTQIVLMQKLCVW